MDTPDRTQIGTPLSKFEDSPVFNYINSLSPIKPVKSINIAQTFNSLSFSSPPSVFTSPHVSSQRESRFLRRNFFSGSSKPDSSSEDGLKGNTSDIAKNAIQVPACSADPQKSFDEGHPIKEVTVDPTNGNLDHAIELPRTLKYDCGSPECKTKSSQVIKEDSNCVVSDVPARLVQFGGEVSIERCPSFQGEVVSHGISQLEQNKDVGTGCDWENLIADASDLLIFDSSNDIDALGTDQTTVDLQRSSFNSLENAQDNTNDMQTTQPIDQIGFSENHIVDDSTFESAVEEHKGTDHTPDVFSGVFQDKKQVSFPSEIVDDKPGSHIPFGSMQRGIRRRCLVFESAGARKRKSEDDSNCSSSVSSQSDGMHASDDNQLVPLRPCTNSSACMIPGIGLHLNALAATTKERRVVKHETLASGKELISMPSSLSTLQSLSEQKLLSKSVVLSLIKTDISPGGNDLQGLLDGSQASAFKLGEDFNESSPKKKRHKFENGGESEACKRCNCKKSKCLKLYCECFAAGVYCVEPCSCQECFNKPAHEDTVLATRKQIESRNPLAFAPKVIRSSDSAPEVGEDSNKTPASARHKRGCNCKKSNCLKKYCECYQGGVGCSVNCRCESCKNTFGQKDGCTLIGFGDAEPELEGTEAGEKNVFGSLQTKEVQKDEEQYPEHTLPVAFSFQICRTSIQLPFSCLGKPPRSSLHSQSKFEKHFQINNPEYETPAILRNNSSPISGVKTISPNCKRVSPPHRDFASSPSRRNSRKLVLQSIPSFPSLTQHETGDLQ